MKTLRRRRWTETGPPAEARALRESREKLNLTQAEIARLVGVTPQTWSRKESGHNPITRRDQLAVEALIKALK